MPSRVPFAGAAFKVDDVKTEDLLNVYGQLMWVLATSGKVLLNQVTLRAGELLACPARL